MIVIVNIPISRFFKLTLQIDKSYLRLFMKIRSFFCAVLSVMMILCGCKDEKPKYGEPMLFKVFGVNGNPDISSNLKMGLFVGAPVDADNVAFTVGPNGSVIPEKEVKWGFDQSQSSRLFAYAPYDPSFTGQETVDFDIPSDQSTPDKLLKANLLVGVTSGGPNDKAVTIKMKHAMTAMTVTFDNRTGEKIKDLSVSGFITSAKMNLVTGELKATTSKKNIIPMRSPDDENTFVFVYLPQDVTPVFKVTLASGKTMAYTFDNYCHEYPGRVLRMHIQLDDSATDANILELNGVSISQWNTNDIPSFGQSNIYMNLIDLRKIEPDAKQNGFFTAYLNKVTVTAVDKTSKDILGVVLEDSTLAIHVWTNVGINLKPGNTIAGPIMGLMDKPNSMEFHISYFHTDYATVGKTDVLPLTEGSFSNLADNISKLEYRRMVFKDAIVEEAFDNGRAVFRQGDVSLSVVCPALSISLAQGARGDLIGFPVSSGNEIMIMVYDENDLMSFTKDEVDNALTRSEAYGVYDITVPENPVYMLSGKDADTQYSVRYLSFGHSMQVSDIRNGEANTVLISQGTGSYVVGHEYVVAFSVQGKTAQEGSTLYMECVKVDEKTAWLTDRSGKYGLVMAL